MYRKVIDDAKAKMEKTREFYQHDMLSLRAGRANPQILDKIMVDYPDTGTVSCSDTYVHDQYGKLFAEDCQPKGKLFVKMGNFLLKYHKK